jgi:hypothetical protein
MNRVIKAGLTFFLLATIIGAQENLFGLLSEDCKIISGLAMPADEDRDFPTDAEEDNSETRKSDEYEPHVFDPESQGNDRLLNLHYTYLHLLFKEHHIEAVVPPPKG